MSDTRTNREEPAATECTEASECGENQECIEGKCADKPDPAKNIGRVIIARGNIAWDVKPPVWDDLVSPCCTEPDPCRDVVCKATHKCVDGKCEPIPGVGEQ